MKSFRRIIFISFLVILLSISFGSSRINRYYNGNIYLEHRFTI